MSPHNNEHIDHACARIAETIRDAYELELAPVEVREVLDNISTRRDLADNIEVAILTEALGYNISPAVANVRTRVTATNTPSSIGSWNA